MTQALHSTWPGIKRGGALFSSLLFQKKRPYRHKLMRIRIRNFKKRRQQETNKHIIARQLDLESSPPLSPFVMHVIYPSKTFTSPHATLPLFSTFFLS
ncbi:hypothetical protein E2C01_037334 [Portunus trituberculatus]|uniref:Uncharacterized protein n=1 Tax=Portunus trituberculatus TaxID=210409 RepID=A0A5B7FF19_PORTR|nr:hypothetical protein [Portunus trituberculatus]